MILDAKLQNLKHVQMEATENSKAIKATNNVPNKYRQGLIFIMMHASNNQHVNETTP